MSLNQANGLVLGITSDATYEEFVQRLQPGDQIVFYTDGISDARSPEGEMFTTQRLDQTLENCSLQASALLDAMLRSVEEFANGCPADDDRTLIVAPIT